MFTYRLHLAGSQLPVDFTLPNNDLFEAFIKWVNQDVEFKARGFVVNRGSTRPIVFNFENIACMAITSEKS